jgi:hypothetical protein
MSEYSNGVTMSDADEAGSTAEVCGCVLGGAETEMKVARVFAGELSRPGGQRHGNPGVQFTLTWGTGSGRDFTVYGQEDIRDLARVLAAAAGTRLADEQGTSHP